MSKARGQANAQPPGRAKFANAPPPGLARHANAPQLPGGGGGGGWAQLELTDALPTEYKLTYIFLNKLYFFIWSSGCIKKQWKG